EGVQIVSPYTDAGATQIAPGGTIAYAELNFVDRTSAEYADDADRIVELRDEAEATAVDGVRIELGGDIFAEEAASSSEAIGLVLAVVILLIAFGSLLAMGLPIVTALIGIGCGASIVTLLANVVDMPDFTIQAVLMIAIGVGIDYALFVVTRYREVLHRGASPE